MKSYCCWKEGKKLQKGTENKSYTKLDYRSDCKAKLQFSIGVDGDWTVSKHIIHHNHAFCAIGQRHLLKSHRGVDREYLEFIMLMKESGTKVSDIHRMLQKQSGGVSSLGFTKRDAYNVLESERSKMFDGTDSNTLIGILKKRAELESDFFFDFDLDDGILSCFFWRDGHMKSDYDRFGDVVIHDTTYRTNKYDMICGPFVGMNHHCKNIMFGCGFMLNEKVESFVWLFQTFLKSMGGKHPITFMTDQSFSMAAAIKSVFPNARHRLCTWHIDENSKKHIMFLRKKLNFVPLFDYVVKRCDTIAEFDFYWTELNKVYECSDNTWLKRLYSHKEKWCPAFSKDYFSGGILSSQRSESTNRSISRRLSKTATLCDFYKMFGDIVEEWRSEENGQDFRCSEGTVEMVLLQDSLLTHARDVYTLEIFKLFQEQYLKGMSHFFKLVTQNCHDCVYHVWLDGVDLIRHSVTFNANDNTVTCTCKMFSEVGILCRHILRIYNIHCVKCIPRDYIMSRWTKGAILPNMGRSHIEAPDTLFGKILEDSVWRVQMTRKFNTILASSASIPEARQVCEQGYDSIKNFLDIQKRRTAGDESASESRTILDPPRSVPKGQRNTRKKSIVEKQCKIVKSRRSKSQQVSSNSKLVAQSVVQETVNCMVPHGYLAHPVHGMTCLMPMFGSPQVFTPYFLHPNVGNEMQI
ncbi:unnamed protein product [Cuscuta epithymum]|nr:unnamed protein product [Cuscuta epithymum]